MTLSPDIKHNFFIEEDILKLGELIKQYREQNNQTSKKVKYNSIKNNELGKEIKSLKKTTNKVVIEKTKKQKLKNDSSTRLF